MQVVHERCCGLDVHKKTVVACVRTDQGQQTRTYGTVTRELLRLWDWLDQEHVTAVAMNRADRRDPRPGSAERRGDPG